MATLSFDGALKRVKVTFDPLESHVTLLVQEIYSQWKEWVQIGNNSQWTQAFLSIGGEPIGGGEYVGSTFFILDGWKIAPITTVSDSELKLDGNLFSEVVGESLVDLSLMDINKHVVVERRTSVYPAGVSSSGDASAISDAVWAKVVETPLTAQDLMRLFAAVHLGTSQIAGHVITFKDINAIINRVVANMDPQLKYRQNVTLNPA